MFDLVFISGATGGLGKAFAVECASRNWDLFLTDVSEQRLSRLAASLRHTYGVRVFFRECDLTDADLRADLFSWIQRKGFHFHMLINVAGVDYEGLFSERSRAEIQTIIRLNIESTLDVTHALLDLTSPNQSFRIINVSSLAAFYPMPVKATYAASKRFLLDFSFALRDELKDRGATVTVLCPAGLPTTQTCIEAIQAQGFMGKLTTLDIGFVAAKTIDHALRGHTIYIPGVLNQFLQRAGGLLPPISLAGMIGNRWRSANKSRRMLSQEQAEDRLGGIG